MATILSQPQCVNELCLGMGKAKPVYPLSTLLMNGYNGDLFGSGTYHLCSPPSWHQNQVLEHLERSASHLLFLINLLDWMPSQTKVDNPSHVILITKNWNVWYSYLSVQGAYYIIILTMTPNFIIFVEVFSKILFHKCPVEWRINRIVHNMIQQSERLNV